MAETYDDRGQGGAVVLDIGDDVGALILYTGEELRGREIEVSPKGRDAWRVHTAIRERQANGRTIFAGVYLALPADDYTIWRDATTPAGEVTIVGGAVAEADWRKLVGDAPTPKRTDPQPPVDGLSEALRTGPQPASLGPDPAGSANTGCRDSQAPRASSSRSAPPEMLPPRYRMGKVVSAAPMGSAPMRYADDGRVAWDQMWTDFCDLALAGGPPHRDSVLGPVDPGEALPIRAIPPVLRGTACWDPSIRARRWRLQTPTRAWWPRLSAGCAWSRGCASRAMRVLDGSDWNATTRTWRNGFRARLRWRTSSRDAKVPRCCCPPGHASLWTSDCPAAR